MSYLDHNILPDEEILYRTRKHYILFLTPFLWTCATLFLFSQHNIYIDKAAYVFGIIAILAWLYQLLLYSVSEYAVTTKRILMREGFFVRHINETRIATISNVNIDQNIFGQILNYGTIIIKTYGGDDDPFMDIPKPFIFKRVLEIQLDKVVAHTNNQARKEP
jgi:uncharacterized membrane protein YdbT with pleckstrin-like domain